MTKLRLIDLLPPWYAEVLDYQAICEAEQPMFDDIQAAAAQMLLNLGWLTMDVDAVKLWEQALQIMADPTIESLDFRRFRILNRISTKPPYTKRFLEQKLDEMIGEGLWSLDIDYANYTIYIESNAQDQAYSQEVEFTVNHVKPAHIAYVHRGVIIKDVLVNEGITVAAWPAAVP